MVRSNWAGALLLVAGWVGLAGSQTAADPARGQNLLFDRTIKIQENGRTIHCRVWNNWPLPEGKQAYLVQDFASGEFLTLIQGGPARPLGRKRQALPLEIFHWGKRIISPEGAPVPPHGPFAPGFSDFQEANREEMKAALQKASYDSVPPAPAHPPSKPCVPQKKEAGKQEDSTKSCPLVPGGDPEFPPLPGPISHTIPSHPKVLEPLAQVGFEGPPSIENASMHPKDDNQGPCLIPPVRILANETRSCSKVCLGVPQVKIKPGSYPLTLNGAVSTKEWVASPILEKVPVQIQVLPATPSPRSRFPFKLKSHSVNLPAEERLEINPNEIPVNIANTFESWGQQPLGAVRNTTTKGLLQRIMEGRNQKQASVLLTGEEGYPMEFASPGWDFPRIENKTNIRFPSSRTIFTPATSKRINLVQEPSPGLVNSPKPLVILAAKPEGLPRPVPVPLAIHSTSGGPESERKAAANSSSSNVQDWRTTWGKTSQPQAKQPGQTFLESAAAKDEIKGPPVSSKVSRGPKESRPLEKPDEEITRVKAEAAKTSEMKATPAIQEKLESHPLPPPPPWENKRNQESKSPIVSSPQKPPPTLSQPPRVSEEIPSPPGMSSPSGNVKLSRPTDVVAAYSTNPNPDAVDQTAFKGMPPASKTVNQPRKDPLMNPENYLPEPKALPEEPRLENEKKKKPQKKDSQGSGLPRSPLNFPLGAGSALGAGYGSMPTQYVPYFIMTQPTTAPPRPPVPRIPEAPPLNVWVNAFSGPPQKDKEPPKGPEPPFGSYQPMPYPPMMAGPGGFPLPPGMMGNPPFSLPQRPVLPVNYPTMYNGPQAPNPIMPMNGGPPPFSGFPPPYPWNPYPSAPPVAPVHPHLAQLAVLQDLNLPAMQREWAALSLASADVRQFPQAFYAIMTAAHLDPAPAVRSACIHSLSRMNVSAEVLTPALQRALADPDSLVQREAEQALSRLGLKKSNP